MNGTVVLLGAAWFTTRLPLLRNQIRPIYREMGIIPEDGLQLAEEEIQQ
jgi:hypothetical protein